MRWRKSQRLVGYHMSKPGACAVVVAYYNIIMGNSMGWRKSKWLFGYRLSKPGTCAVVVAHYNMFMGDSMGWHKFQWLVDYRLSKSGTCMGISLIILREREKKRFRVYWVKRPAGVTFYICLHNIFISACLLRRARFVFISLIISLFSFCVCATMIWNSIIWYLDTF